MTWIVFQHCNVPLVFLFVYFFCNFILSYGDMPYDHAGRHLSDGGLIPRLCWSLVLARLDKVEASASFWSVCQICIWHDELTHGDCILKIIWEVWLSWQAEIYVKISNYIASASKLCFPFVYWVKHSLIGFVTMDWLKA